MGSITAKDAIRFRREIKPLLSFRILYNSAKSLCFSFRLRLHSRVVATDKEIELESKCIQRLLVDIRQPGNIRLSKPQKERTKIKAFSTHMQTLYCCIEPSNKRHTIYCWLLGYG